MKDQPEPSEHDLEFQRNLVRPASSVPPSARLEALIEKWVHNSRLQTYEDRERFRKEAGDALAALRQGPAAAPTPSAEGWQPIETAPKDGTKILAANDHDYYIAEWSTNANGSFNWNNTEYTFTPAHWLPLEPLPAPPAANLQHVDVPAPPAASMITFAKQVIANGGRTLDEMDTLMLAEAFLSAAALLQPHPRSR